jgi:hypothetical protein
MVPKLIAILHVKGIIIAKSHELPAGLLKGKAVLIVEVLRLAGYLAL